MIKIGYADQFRRWTASAASTAPRFDQMKIRHTHRFIVYKIKDDKSAIEIETEGLPGGTS